MKGRQMKSALIIISAMLAVSGCASHKGAIKPNSALADFDKYGEAYYLSLDQIAIGDSKAPGDGARRGRRAGVGARSVTVDRHMRGRSAPSDGHRRHRLPPVRVRRPFRTAVPAAVANCHRADTSGRTR